MPPEVITYTSAIDCWIKASNGSGLASLALVTLVCPCGHKPLSTCTELSTVHHDEPMPLGTCSALLMKSSVDDETAT